MPASIILINAGGRNVKTALILINIDLLRQADMLLVSVNEFCLPAKFHSVVLVVVERLWALDGATSGGSGVGQLWMTWLQSSSVDLMSGHHGHGWLWVSWANLASACERRGEA